MMTNAKNLMAFLVLLLCVSGAATSYAAKDEAERLWGLGEKAYNEGKYQDARSHYQKSLTLCAGNPECMAANLNGIGAVYEALDDDHKAFKYYEEALSAARKANHRDLTATNLFNTGAIYYRTFHQYDKALDRFEDALKIFREIQDGRSAAIVLFNMGKVLNSQGRYDRALPLLNESLRISKSENNEQAAAGALNIIGNVHANLGQYDKPLAYYQDALRINRRLNNPQETATTLRNIGDAYCDLKERDKAIGYYREALAIQKRHNLRLDMAMTSTNMGALYKELDQYDQALVHYEEALKGARALDSKPLVATNLNNIGNVYASLGKSDRALSAYRESLKIDRQLGRPPQIAVTLNNIGMEYFRLEQYERALHHLREALDIERTLNNPHNIAARLNNIGAVYLRQQRYAEAEAVLLERKEMGKRITRTRLIHAGLVEVYLATQRYDAALALLKELPPNWRDSRNRRLEYQTQLGLALRGRGDLRKSTPELLKAVSIVEEIRRAVGDRGDFFAGGGYIGRVTPYRELAADLSALSLAGERQPEDFQPYGKNAAASAFHFAELTKARELLERMAGAARKYEDPRLPPAIKNREAGLLKELADIEGKWESAYAGGEGAFQRFRQQEEALRQELDVLVASIRQDDPLYAAIHYPRPIPAEELPLRDDEVLIAFGVSSKAVTVFIVRKGGVKRIENIHISGSELAGKVKKFMEPFSSGQHTSFSTAGAAELYALLLKEAVKDVKESERLIIVPDGILGLLPFEALVVTAGKDERDCVYAGDRWVITYAQSATSLALARLLKPQAAAKPLFALGNPVYNQGDPRYAAYKQGKPESADVRNLKQYAYRGVTIQAKPGGKGDEIAWEEVTYPPLPETEDEVRAIAKLFGVKAEPPDILLGLAASEANLRKADLGAYRYLHFATHADLPGKIQGIKEPFIILGQVENKGADDGFLTLSEVLALKLNADLVVLSACSTGRGRLMEGEGVANFARAFQHAGARGVVASLWEVASDAAVEYMISFYRRIQAGTGNAEALRLARKEIKAKYPHPFYWSVFVLYGADALK